MASLKSTVEYPKYTKDSIKAAMKSPMGEEIVWCVVEAPDDIAVYGKFFDAATVKLQPSDIDGRRGCRNVETIVAELHNEVEDIKLFGIRDADYTRYTSSYVAPANVFLTDDRDVEMMMLKSSSVSTTLTEHDFSNKINDAVSAVRYLGYLRIFNEVEQIGCPFRNKVAKTSLMWCGRSKRLKPDYKTGQFNEFKPYCDAKSGHSVTSEEISAWISSHALDSEPSSNICRGHDAVKLLSCMMTGTAFIDKTILQKHITDSYSFDDFSTTRLYSDISAWAAAAGVAVFNL